MEDRKLATIRKWVAQKGWGIANAPYSSTEIPKRYFVHISNAPEDSQLRIGVRISFIEGPARHTGELPTALEVEVVPVPPPQPQKDGGAL